MPSTLDVSPTRHGLLWPSSANPQPKPDHDGAFLSINVRKIQEKPSSASSSGSLAVSSAANKLNGGLNAGRYRTNVLCALSFGPGEDGDVLACADSRGSLYTISLGGNKYSHICQTHGEISDVSFSNYRRKEVFVAFKTGDIYCYNLDSGARVATLRGHRRSVDSLSMHPTSSSHRMLSCSADSILIWCTKSMQKIQALTSERLSFLQASYTSTINGSYIITCSADELHVWETDSNQLVATLVPPASEPHAHITHFTTSPDGRYLVAGSANSKTFFLWDLPSFTLLRCIRLPDDTNGCDQLTFLSDSLRLAVLTSGRGSRVLIVDIVGFAISAEFSPKHADVIKMAIDSSSGQWMTVALSDGTLIAYDIGTATNHYKKLRESMENRPEPFLKSRAIIGQESSSIEPETYSQDSDDAILRSGPKYLKPKQVDEVFDSDREQHSGPTSIQAQELEEAHNTFRDPSVPVASAAAPLSSSSSSQRQQKNSSKGNNSTASAGGYDFSNPSGSVQRLFASKQVSDFSKGNPPAPSSLSVSIKGSTKDSLNRKPKPSDIRGLKISNLSPSDALLNLKELRKLLDKFGQYPDEYRTYIWRFLVCLPERSEAFDLLQQRGVHSAFKDLHQRYPLKNATLFRRLEKVLSALAHYCPVFASAQEMIPPLVFPFVNIFESDIVSCFETVLTLFHNWFSAWFEFHPSPPLTVLNLVENLLDLHDPDLMRHFDRCGISSALFAWEMMQNGFTEVLSRQEWIRTMDHVLSSQPVFLHFFTVALLITHRGTLLDLTQRHHFEEFFKGPQPRDIDGVLRLAKKLHSETPLDLPNEFTRFRPLHMKSPAAYPPFTRYPRFVVDYQVKEREKLLMEESELLKSKQEAAEIQRRTLKLQAEQGEWIAKQQALLEAEEMRRKESYEMHLRMQKERSAMDELTRSERLKYIASVEDNSQRFLMQQQAVRESEMNRIQQEAHQQAERHQYELMNRLEDEKLKRLELAAEERLHHMTLARDLDKHVSQMKLDVESKKQQAELDMKALEETWKNEDKELDAKNRADSERRERMALMNEQLRAQRKLEHSQRLVEVEQAIRLQQVEHERKLRKIGHDALKQVEDLGKLNLERERLAADEEDRQARLLVERDLQMRAELADEREKLVERERRQQALEMEMRAQKLRDLEREQRARDMELKLEEQRRMDRGNQEAQEREVQRVLLAYEEERRKDKELEREMLQRDRDLKERLQYQRQLRQAEDESVRIEREKFDKLRFEMRTRFEAEERQLSMQHEKMMNQLRLLNERDALQFGGELRRRIVEEQLAVLQQEQADFEQRLKQRTVEFAAQEKRLMTQLRQSIFDIRNASEESVSSAASASGASSSAPARQSVPLRTGDEVFESWRDSELARIRASSASASAEGLRQSQQQQQQQQQQQSQAQSQAQARMGIAEEMSAADREFEKRLEEKKNAIRQRLAEIEREEREAAISAAVSADVPSFASSSAVSNSEAMSSSYYSDSGDSRDRRPYTPSSSSSSRFYSSSSSASGTPISPSEASSDSFSLTPPSSRSTPFPSSGDRSSMYTSSPDSLHPSSSPSSSMFSSSAPSSSSSSNYDRRRSSRSSGSDREDEDEVILDVGDFEQGLQRQSVVAAPSSASGPRREAAAVQSVEVRNRAIISPASSASSSSVIDLGSISPASSQASFDNHARRRHRRDGDGDASTASPSSPSLSNLSFVDSMESDSPSGPSQMASSSVSPSDNSVSSVQRRAQEVIQRHRDMRQARK